MVWVGWMAVAWGAGVWNQLHPVEATASSFLVSNWNRFTENYHPNYVLDDNPATAWVEGAAGNGEGSTLTLELSRLPKADSVKLRVRNGYQKRADLLTANAAPKDIDVTLFDERGEVVSKAFTLERRMGWQEITIPVGGARGLTRIDLTVRSVHEGRKYKDTCISDVQVLVDSDVPYRAAQEQAQLAATQAWIAERVKAAAYFASKPVNYPFAATDFQLENGRYARIDASEGERRLAPYRDTIERLAASPTLYRATAKSIPRRPEGLGAHDLEAVLPYLQPGNVSFFETDEPVATKQEEGSEADGYLMRLARSNVRLERSPGYSVPRRVFFWTNEYQSGRAVQETRRQVVLEFDKAGRLVTRAEATTSSFMDMASKGGVLVTFRYDDANQIDRVEQWAFDRSEDQSHGYHHVWVPR